MSWFAPVLNVLSWERCDFHVSFSGRDKSKNVWIRPSGNYMVDMGISSNIMNPPPLSQMLHDIHIKWRPQLIRHFTKSWPCYRTWPYNVRITIFDVIPRGIHRTFATGGVSQQRTLTAPDTWSCPFGDLHLFYCSNHSFLNLSYIRTFWVSNIPRYFYFVSHTYHAYLLNLFYTCFHMQRVCTKQSLIWQLCSLLNITHCDSNDVQMFSYIKHTYYCFSY